MKQKDIALVILIVGISGLISFFISNSFISSSNKTEEAAVVEPITDEFVEPSDEYFNEQSVNPTQTITIEGTDNPNPFN